jgi:hypothetical protein
MWTAMAPHERQAFVDAASRDGVQLTNTNEAQARAYLQRRPGV